MKRISKTLTILSVVSLGILFSCKKSENVVPQKPKDQGAGENEVVTTVKLNLTDNSGSSPVTISPKWYDADGESGGAAPIIDTIKLFSGKTYSLETLVLNQVASPVDTVSKEIEKEGDEHRFHYIFTSNSGSTSSIAVTLTDLDDKGALLGLKANFVVTGSGKGVLNVKLRHFGIGEIKSSDPVAGGSDIEILMPVVVIP